MELLARPVARERTQEPLICPGDLVDVVDVLLLLLGGPPSPIELIFRLISDVDYPRRLYGSGLPNESSMVTIRSGASDSLEKGSQILSSRTRTLPTRQPIIADLDRKEIVLRSNYNLTKAVISETGKTIGRAGSSNPSLFTNLETQGRAITDMINLSADELRLNSARVAVTDGTIAVDMPSVSPGPVNIREPSFHSAVSYGMRGEPSRSIESSRICIRAKLAK